MKLTAFLATFALAGSALAGTSTAGAGKAACCPPMPTADELLGFTLSTGYDSAYLFHGTDVGDNLIWQKLEFSKQINDKRNTTEDQDCNQWQIDIPEALEFALVIDHKPQDKVGQNPDDGQNCDRNLEDSGRRFRCGGLLLIGGHDAAFFIF